MAKATAADGGTTVTNSDGETVVVPKKADFGTVSLGRALLTPLMRLGPRPCRGAANAAMTAPLTTGLDQSPMRAETQGNVEAIGKSLKLLAQRMDWETAPHRLEEFDAHDRGAATCGTTRPRRRS